MPQSSGFRQLKIFAVWVTCGLAILAFWGLIARAHMMAARSSPTLSSVTYEVKWGQPNDEILSISHKSIYLGGFFNIESSVASVTRHDAAGVNICVTDNKYVDYAFFKDSIYRVDQKKGIITAINMADISTPLHYDYRIEVVQAADAKKPGEIKFVKAPDPGSGPKEPCSLK